MYKEVHPFYKTKQWIRKRKRVLRESEYMCRQCKRYGKSTQATTIHHIYPLENYPEYKLTDENLMALCQSCHGKMHDRNTNELTDLGEFWKNRTIIAPPL